MLRRASFLAALKGEHKRRQETTRTVRASRRVRYAVVAARDDRRRVSGLIRRSAGLIRRTLLENRLNFGQSPTRVWERDLKRMALTGLPNAPEDLMHRWHAQRPAGYESSGAQRTTMIGPEHELRVRPDRLSADQNANSVRIRLQRTADSSAARLACHSSG